MMKSECLVSLENYLDQTLILIVHKTFSKASSN